MKYLLPLLLLTGCGNTQYTTEQCAEYILDRSGEQVENLKLKQALIFLCELFDNDPKAVIREINK